MRKPLSILVIGFAAAVVGVGQKPIGNVTSSAPFELRGAAVNPGQGVPSWPVLAGDDLKAGTALTIVTFTDGSVVTLEPGSTSHFSIVGSTSTPVFRLVLGVANYSLRGLNSVRLMVGEKHITVTSLKGTLKAGSKISSGGGGFWTPTHTVLVVAGVGGATAAGLGIGAATSNGSPVSPSH